MNKLDMESMDIVDSNVEIIKNLFPNSVKEGQIDFDALKQELSNDILDDKKEKYQILWPGKRDAIIKANTKTTNTLRPLIDKSSNFDKTRNVYIEGDNFDALKILQESYLNKISCIYIDPPYNTGNDFIYNDNFTKDAEDELISSGQIDEVGNRLTSNSQSNGRFHSDWLNMIYPRLKLSRNLLREDGIIFISIDDNEYANLKKVCDEVFGEKSYIATFIWKKTSNPNTTGNNIGIEHEYILMYVKSDEYTIKYLPLDSSDLEKYTGEDEYIETRGPFKLVGLNKTGTVNDLRPNLMYDITAPDGSIIKPQPRWRWSKDKFENGIKENRVVFKENNGKWSVYYKQYLNEDTEGNIIERGNLVKTIFDDCGRTTDGTLEINNLLGKGMFDFPKPTSLIKKILYIATDKNDIILDFFSGSSTTADAVMQLNSEDKGNRRFIMIQLPEKCDGKYDTICDMAEDRIRKASERLNNSIDNGFRVFRIDSTNMKDVYYKPSDVSQMNLLDYISNIKDDRTSEDLLIQVMLDLGLTLDLKIEEKTILNNKVFYVENNSLIACFDDEIDINIVDEICKCKPMKVVFKDTSFRTDKDKINLEEKTKKLSPDTEVSV